MPTQAFGGHRYLPNEVKDRRLHRPHHGGGLLLQKCANENIHETFKEKRHCEKHQPLSKAKYSSFKANDYSVKTRDEGCFITSPKKVY
jgi:hypothetical protein